LPTSYRQDADALGDGIQPFLVSGGRANYLELDGEQFAAPNAVQLVTSVYVPPGRIGFIKQLRIAPRMPPVFADGWRGLAFNFQWFPTAPVGARVQGQIGVWDVPMGWESYTLDPIEFPLGVPYWAWSLQLMQGTIEDARGTRPPFSTADLFSQYLVPDVAVSADAYGETSGIRKPALPGHSPGEPFSGQRMQVLQGDQLSFHVPIPPDHTALLFASWRQEAYSAFQVLADNPEGVTVHGVPTFPLWPSFGQLLGYTQPTTNDTAIANARFGWGG
jgi:hypothetical protein